MRRRLLLLAILLAPPATVLGVLAVGPAPEVAAEPVSLPEVRVAAAPAAPDPVERELRFTDEEGAPLAGVVAVLLEPEFAVGRSGDDGRATLVTTGVEGAIRLTAATAGREVLDLRAPSWPEAPLTLAVLPDRPLADPAETALAPRRFRVVPAAATGALRDALLAVRPRDAADTAAALAATDADGRAELLLPPPPWTVAVFAPGFGPRPEALLLEHEVAAAPAGEVRLEIRAGALTVRGLPPRALVELRRDGASLGLYRVPISGRLTWPVLPPGHWTLAHGDEEAVEVLLEPGETTVEWPRSGG